MITTVLEFFALGTLGFWILSAILSAVFIACIENDSKWFPTVVLLGLGIAYWKQLAALALGWQAILIGVIAYVLIGVAWSFFRWYRYVQKAVKEDSKLKAGDYAIAPSHNSSRIIGWIAYWPWSLIWNITGDFFTTLYERLSNVYQSISDKVANSAINSAKK